MLQKNLYDSDATEMRQRRGTTRGGVAAHPAAEMRDVPRRMEVDPIFILKVEGKYEKEVSHLQIIRFRYRFFIRS